MVCLFPKFYRWTKIVKVSRRKNTFYPWRFTSFVIDMLYLHYDLKIDCKTKKSGQIFPIFGIIFVLHHKNAGFHMTNLYSFQYIDFVWFISSKSWDINNKKWFPIKRKERKSTRNAEKKHKMHSFSYFYHYCCNIWFSAQVKSTSGLIYAYQWF